VVTVAKKNGDFSDVLLAMESIKDASETNPYLIVIGPGVYTLTESLRVKDFVSISGAGEESTEIAMATADRPTVVLGESGSGGLSTVSVENLTIRNSVSGARSCNAMIGGFLRTTISNVRLIAQGCSGVNVGAQDICGSIRFENVFIRATGATAVGLRTCALGGQIFLENMKISVFGESSSIGVSSSFTSINIKNSSINALGRGNIIGVLLEDVPEPSSVENSEILATSAGILYTNRNSNTSTGNDRLVTVRRSTVSGGSSSIFGDALSNFNVSQSTLIGSAGGDNNGALKTCVASDNGNGVALTEACLE